MAPSSDTPRRNFYGRLKGKPLRPNQLRLLQEDLPKYRLQGVVLEENPARHPIELPTQLKDKPLWLEIGFGGGEHLVHQACQNPNCAFIGAEAYENGIAWLLNKREKAGVENIALYDGDVRDLLEVLPSDCASKVFLLYPDPWPKKRHHRRRFVTPDYLISLARVMQSGAELRLATDIPDYVRQALLEIPKAGFEWGANGPADWRVPWPDWLSTRYEQKALREGRVPHYLTFKKKG